MNYKKLAIALLIPQLVGIIAGIFTRNSIQDWYVNLAKPEINPPDWLFGPVWTVLYLLMGISLYLLWTSKKSEKALNWFYVQLGLNFIWSILFFGLKNPLFAFIDLILLWISILAMIFVTWKIDRKSAWMLVPYLLWVSFAGILNYLAI